MLRIALQSVCAMWLQYVAASHRRNVGMPLRDLQCMWKAFSLDRLPSKYMDDVKPGHIVTLQHQDFAGAAGDPRDGMPTQASSSGGADPAALGATPAAAAPAAATAADAAVGSTATTASSSR